MKFAKYGLFCVLVLVASVLIRRPADVSQEETNPVKRVEASGQVMEVKEASAISARAEPGTEMIKGQKPLRTTTSDEDDEEEDEDYDEDEDDD